MRWVREHLGNARGPAKDPVAARPYGTYLGCVKRLSVLVFVPLLLLAIAMPSRGQGKDPFQPPAGVGGAGAAGGSTTGRVATPGPNLEPPAAPGLPRTGQDVEMLVLAAAVLLIAGGAMQLAGRALSG